jgi:hypothetical protein
MILSSPLILYHDEGLKNTFEKIKDSVYNLLSYCCYIPESKKLRVYCVNLLDSVADLANERSDLIEYREELECLIS